MNKKIVYKSASAGLRVTGYVFIPDNLEPKGILQISHGMGEHFNRYKEFSGYMLKKGFIVCGNDHLGHGDIQKEYKGFMGKKDGYKHMALDMRFIMEYVKKDYPQLPYFILGHSMGSFITRYFMEKWGHELSGVILSGTGQLNGLEKFIYKAILFYLDLMCLIKGPEKKAREISLLMAKVFSASFDGVSCAWQTSDLVKIEEFKKDPLCKVPFSYGGFRDLFKVMLKVSQRESILNIPEDLPILLVSGAKDPVGKFGIGVKSYYYKLKKAGLSHLTLRLYEKGRHEMLNEINRKEVFTYIYQWLISKGC